MNYSKHASWACFWYDYGVTMSPSFMQKDFAKQLIKGKITEQVFDQMFRESRKYTVIPFGYESVVPGLMQYTERSSEDDLLESLRNAPDFALVENKTKEVSLVEVKYRNKLYMDELRDTALRIQQQWKAAKMFIATPDGFYLDRCDDLMKKNSELTPVSDELIIDDLQEKYLKLLNEFIK